MSYSCIISICDKEKEDDEPIAHPNDWNTDNDVWIPSRYKYAVGQFISVHTGVVELSNYKLASIYSLLCVLSALRPIRHKLSQDSLQSHLTDTPGYYRIDDITTNEAGEFLDNDQADVEIMQKALWWTARFTNGGDFDTDMLDSLFFDENDRQLKNMEKLLSTLNSNNKYKAVAYIG